MNLRTSIRIVLAAVGALALGVGQVRADVAAPKPTKEIMAAATAEAKKQQKPVMVIFHATWCGWCKKLEAVMDRPEFKQMFEANYVMVSLDVMENGPKIAEAENPGGKDLMAKLGGEKSGLPFYAWINPKGKKLADSNAMPKDSNIGYPGEPAEIETFIGLIKKTAPNWSEADLKTLHDYLVENAPKSTGAAH